MYLLKGGMALELRFGIRARASRDVDVGILSGGHDLLAAVDRVLAVGFHDFGFRRRDNVLRMERAATYRLEIQITYRGRSFGTLDVDLNEADHETASELLTTSVLTELGLPGPLSVPVLDPYLQIAHKLHGATEPSRPDYTNRRHRDLLDVLVFARDDAAHIDFPRLREIVIEEFSRREHNRVWPPLFELPAAWEEPLRQEASSNGFAVTDPTQLSREFVSFIARIEGVDVTRTHEYQFLNLQERITGGGTLTPEAQMVFDELISKGWSVLYIAPHRHYVDQLQVILGRQVAAAKQLPRLQLRMATEQNPIQERVWLTGTLRNESDLAANKVRIFMTGADIVVRAGSITRGDGGYAVHLRYDDQPAYKQQPQSPTLFVEYLMDDGTKVQQGGTLDPFGPDANGRYTYTGLGLGPPRVIERLTHRHVPLEKL
ncbi:MAG: nucleotidyl transferase AbiEii/AbiGii toxin family protein [Candidatus Cybelea sp.]